LRHRYTLEADYAHGLILFRQGRWEEARAIAEEAYALAKGIFAPTYRLLADLAQLLAEIEGGSTPQRRLPENTTAPFQLA
jgi:Tetratricopeptide repeat